MHKGRWYKVVNTKSVVCELCPRHCCIKNGELGFCNVRKNKDGTLYSLSYGYPVAIQLDPIEKKPLAEFMPGTKTFSIGTLGCNLDCSFCQNYTLSRGTYETCSVPYVAPEELIKHVISSGANSLAFTYNEPIVCAEYVFDTAVLARQRGIPVVMVSNGYITKMAGDDIFPLLDAVNIDMKGFSENFYKEMSDSRLTPVLTSIKKLFELGVHIELTNLIIPTKNDSIDMLKNYLDWVEKELNRDVPLHFSAFFPTHRCLDIPRTPPALLYDIKAYCEQRGFNHIYLGNIR